MAKIHKTSNGDPIDMEKLALKNEKVRAVGNMGVNARGDVVNSDNKTTSTRSKQVIHQYKKQVSGIVQDIPVMNSKKAADIIAKKYVESAVTEARVNESLNALSDPIPSKVPEVAEKIITPPRPDVRVKPVTSDNIDAVIEKVEQKATGGLAGAIAKAKEVKQEPLKTPREEERGGDGVRKI